MTTTTATSKKTRLRCTCEPDEFDRHEMDCDLSPDLSGWYWYPQDGEIEGGGVWVNPADPRVIYLEVKGRLCRVPRQSVE